MGTSIVSIGRSNCRQGLDPEAAGVVGDDLEQPPAGSTRRRSYASQREHRATDGVIVASSPSTIVLLPSLDLETCVAETVCRPLRRPFARDQEHEEEVIRKRFPIYVRLPARKVETMRPIDVVVADLFRAALDQPSPAKPRALAQTC